MTRPAWRRALAVAAALVAALPAATHGQPQARPDRPKVLLLVDGPGDGLMSRLQAELGSMGVEAVVRTRPGPIETTTRAEGAVAAVRRLPSRNGVEVWMADATSGRSLLRQTIVDEANGRPNERLIVLQTAELLRTSLFPHPAAAAPKPVTTAPAPAPVPVIVQTAPVAPRPSELVTGFGLLYGAGGASAAWQAHVAFQHFFSHRVGMALAVSWPVHPGTLTAREGNADVGAITAGAEVVARFAAGRRPLFLTTGLGAAFAAVRATGHPVPEASSQLSSDSPTTYTAVGYLQAMGGWKLTRWLALGVRAMAGAAVAPVPIRFAGNDAGHWGSPVLGAGVFAAVEWE